MNPDLLSHSTTPGLQEAAINSLFLYATLLSSPSKPRVEDVVKPPCTEEETEARRGSVIVPRKQ